MNVPTGYTVLDFVGFTDKGRYDATATYVKNDIVYFGGSSWKCKVDDITGIEPAEGDYWTVFAEGESGSIVNDSAPYVLRTGRDALVKMSLVGATIAWNQLLNPTRTGSQTDRGLTVTKLSDTKQYSVTGKATNENINVWLQGGYNSSTSLFTIPANHVFFVRDCNLYRTAGVNTGYPTIITYLGDDGKVLKHTQLCDFSAARVPHAVVDQTYDLTISPQLYDLTQMFGTTIADYVYSLEQAVEGSGIAWLKSYGFFTKDYYAYDTGSLQSVCTSGRTITAIDGTSKTYPIDNEELRGLFKLDTNKLYADGDIYPSSGNGTRKYGIVDLGSLNWQFVTNSSANITVLKSNAGIIYPKSNGMCICPIYLSTTSTNIWSNASTPDKSIGLGGEYVMVKDSSFIDAATFKTAMSGVYLVYELAEETTFSADPYINPQRSDADGTEEFVDGLTRDVMVPVGNNSQYTVSTLLPIICEYIDAVASASTATE